MLLGDALPVAMAYARLLAGAGVERGLLGPSETDRIWDRHLLNCAAVAELVPVTTTRLADLGSGAGLPGLVLAMLLPAAEVVLVEPMARRTVFLSECAESLGLSKVRIERGRAEDLAGRVDADVVTSRAVAPLDRLAVLASGLARPGGLVLAIKGAGAAGELDQAMPVLRRLGARDAAVVHAGTAVLEQPTTVVRFLAGLGATADRDPVRAARGSRRPLGLSVQPPVRSA